MAYSYIWPLGLPQVPQKGFTEDIGALISRTSMDSGPAKMRYKGKKPAMLNLTFIMDLTQINLLEVFITDTLRGTARFGFKHPRTYNIVEVRVVPEGEGKMYTLSYIAPDYYSISIKFEVLP